MSEQHNRTRISGKIDSSATYFPKDAHCWLDASSLALADGDAVASWTNVSGSANHFVQATAERKPVFKTKIFNGMPVVRFADDFVQAAGMDIGSNISLFFVYQVANVPTGLFDSAPNQTNVLRNLPAGSFDFWDGAPRWNIFSGDYGTTTPHLLTLLISMIPTRTIVQFKNDVYITTHTNASTTGITWANPVIGSINEGSTGYFIGDIAEVIMYNRTLSLIEARQVRKYLINKYALVD